MVATLDTPLPNPGRNNLPPCQPRPGTRRRAALLIRWYKPLHTKTVSRFPVMAYSAEFGFRVQDPNSHRLIVLRPDRLETTDISPSEGYTHVCSMPQRVQATRVPRDKKDQPLTPSAEPENMSMVKLRSFVLTHFESMASIRTLTQGRKGFRQRESHTAIET